MRVVVHDPANELGSIHVAYESPDVVLLYIDLIRKRQQVTAYSRTPTTIHFEEASVTIIGLPFRNFLMAAHTAKYTTLVTFLAKRTLACAVRRDPLWGGRQ